MIHKGPGNVHIANARLQTVLLALREISKGRVPVALAIRLLKTQKRIIAHIETVQEVNNSLIEKYGEDSGIAGQKHVTPEMDGWEEFAKEATILNMVEFDCGQPYVIYERLDDDSEVAYGWVENMKYKLDELSANVLVDLGDLLVIDEVAEEDAGEPELEITDEDCAETEVPALVE